jgi:hypothetical protein
MVQLVLPLSSKTFPTRSVEKAGNRSPDFGASGFSRQQPKSERFQTKPRESLPLPQLSHTHLVWTRSLTLNRLDFDVGRKFSKLYSGLPAWRSANKSLGFRRSAITGYLVQDCDTFGQT